MILLAAGVFSFFTAIGYSIIGTYIPLPSLSNVPRLGLLRIRLLYKFLCMSSNKHMYAISVGYIPSSGMQGHRVCIYPGSVLSKLHINTFNRDYHSMR